MEEDMDGPGVDEGEEYSGKGIGGGVMEMER